MPAGLASGKAAARTLASGVLLAPCAAHANMSHIGTGGTIFFLSLLLLFVFGPPMLAAALAPAGQRLRHYLRGLAGWAILLFATLWASAWIPTQTRAQLPGWTPLAVIGLLLAIYVIGVVIPAIRAAMARRSS